MADANCIGAAVKLVDFSIPLVREGEEMRGVTGRDLAQQIDAVLEEARKVRY
jgi:hypothetical protein